LPPPCDPVPDPAALSPQAAISSSATATRGEDGQPACSAPCSALAALGGKKRCTLGAYSSSSYGTMQRVAPETRCTPSWQRKPFTPALATRALPPGIRASNLATAQRVAFQGLGGPPGRKAVVPSAPNRPARRPRIFFFTQPVCRADQALRAAFCHNIKGKDNLKCSALVPEALHKRCGLPRRHGQVRGEPRPGGTLHRRRPSCASRRLSPARTGCSARGRKRCTSAAPQVPASVDFTPRCSA
jgi:hypothetical protein